jgi:hypothetical protein
MTTQHDAIDFFAGDDWEIRATCLDENGAPYSFTPMPEIEWALMDKYHKRVINGTDISISVVDPVLAICSIIVPATATTKLATGTYTDTLRITVGGVTSTLANGPIHVTHDVFKETP